MKKYLAMSAIILSVVAGWTFSANAQNEEEEISYSYGIVVSQSPAQIVVLEYDYDRDAEIQVTYEINAETKAENVEALNKLQKDDGIEIYYKETGGKKVATSIEKELLVDDDAAITLPDEMMEDVMPEEGLENLPAEETVSETVEPSAAQAENVSQ